MRPWSKIHGRKDIVLILWVRPCKASKVRHCHDLHFIEEKVQVLETVRQPWLWSSQRDLSRLSCHQALQPTTTAPQGPQRIVNQGMSVEMADISSRQATSSSRGKRPKHFLGKNVCQSFCCFDEENLNIPFLVRRLCLWRLPFPMFKRTKFS